jgi:glucose-6-phosphate isomerase
MRVQVAMESNGKGVDINGQPLPYKAGEVDFGEPGTNGQHSFYQLIHQGRPVPAEFIGVVRSQQSVYLKGEIVSNHDELMCNFFAQADALAVGKSPVELRSENVPDSLIPHKTFTGNRPSMSIMLPELNAYTVGQLLALYENRIATQVCTDDSVVVKPCEMHACLHARYVHNVTYFLASRSSVRCCCHEILAQLM